MTLSSKAVYDGYDSNTPPLQQGGLLVVSSKSGFNIAFSVNKKATSIVAANRQT